MPLTAKEILFIKFCLNKIFIILRHCFDLNMLGDYTIGSGALSETYTNPVSFSQDSDAAVHALAGVQFKVAILRIYAEATVAEYSSYNIGVGIGLRN